MLLAIDSCGHTGGVALDSRDAAAVYFRELAGKTFSERLLTTISEVLDEASISLRQLTGIVVVHGPGSFTGIRIGVSAAKGLAEGLNIPLIALSRLDLLARKTPQPDVIAVLDAGRSEFFTGVFRAVELAADDRSASPIEVLMNHDQLAALAADLHLPVVYCEDHLAAALSPLQAERIATPTAVDALNAGLRRFRNGDFDDVATVDADYVRRSQSEMLARIAAHAAHRETAVREASVTP
jgi:tRNA threonylcarbamoyladenosine biosynthesis protein TsaB